MRIAKRLAFAITTAGVVLGAVELLARWAAPVPRGAQFGQQVWVIGEVLRFDQTDSAWLGDPELLWRMKPHFRVTWTSASPYDGVVTDSSGRLNGNGWRGPEVGAKQRGELRVLNLGDSCTWGLGVHEDETYSERLGPLLTERTHARWSSVNAGVPSYSSLQGRRFFSRYGAELAPDVVTLYFGWNDAWEMCPDSKNRLMEPSFTGSVLRILYRSQAFKRARLLLFDHWRGAPRVSVAEFRENLLELIERIRARKATPILITPAAGPDPKSPAPAREPPNREYVAMIRTVASETRTLLVDTVADFDGEHPLYFHDPIHPNAAGHARIASLLADAIIATAPSPGDEAARNQPHSVP